MATFSEAQEKALRMANDGILTSLVPDRTEKDVFGFPEPGVAVFRKLIKDGFVFETEEDPITLDNGTVFEFTPSYYLTDEGEKALAELGGDRPSM